MDVEATVLSFCMVLNGHNGYHVIAFMRQRGWPEWMLLNNGIGG